MFLMLKPNMELTTNTGVVIQIGGGVADCGWFLEKVTTSEIIHDMEEYQQEDNQPIYKNVPRGVLDEFVNGKCGGGLISKN